MAYTLLPAVGTAFYNGYTFSPFVETLGIEARPRFDKAHRTVTHTIFEIILRDRIERASAGGCDADFLTIRRQLEQPAGQLRYESKGHGGLNINIAGAKDVMWGPKTDVVSWKPKGRENAIEFTWRVEVAIPDCANARYTGYPMEWTWKYGVRKDYGGYSTRTISGYLRIPQTRQSAGATNLQDTADRFLESVIPPVPLGFQRIQNDHDIDESKCELTYTVSDQQLPAPLPAGVVKCSAQQQTKNAGAMNLFRWQTTLSARYEMLAGISPAVSWGHFVALVTDRVLAGKDKAAQDVVFLSLELGEPEIFGKPEATFGATWTWGTAIAQLLSASGLWRAVPNTSHAQWAASIGRASAPRGLAQFRLSPADDIIVDLCAGQTRFLRAMPPVQIRPPGLRGGQAILVSQPRPERSWLQLRLGVEWQPQNQLMAVPKLGEVTLRANPRGSVAPGFDPSDLTLARGAGRAAGHHVQQRTGSKLEFDLIGEALRAGYEIPAPQIASVAGRAAIQANSALNYFRQQCVVIGPVPIYRALWRLHYVLTELPPPSSQSRAKPVYDIGTAYPIGPGGRIPGL